MHWADAVIGAFSEPVVVTDTALRVLACNPPLARLARATFLDPNERPLDEAFPCFGAAMETFRRVVTDGSSRSVECRLPSDGRGPETWLEARATPWRDAKGGGSGLVMFVQDITARRRRATLEDALATVGQSLGSSLDLNEVLDVVAARALEVMAAEQVLVVGWDGEASGYSVLRAVGRLSREYLAARTIPAGRGPIGRAVKEARTFTTPNILTDPQWLLPADRRREIEAEGFRAVASAPLLAKGRVHGALVVHYWTERSFSDDEVVALSRLAAQAAIAIDNAVLYGQATRRADRLRELANVEAVLMRPLDLEHVLKHIAEATTRMLSVPLTEIWTVTAETRALERRATSTTAVIAEEVLPQVLPADDPLVIAVVAARARIHVTDVNRDPRGRSMQWAVGFGLPALDALPIVSGDEVVGALTLHGAEGSQLTEEDHAVLVSVASRIALAVRNAREYGDAVRRATRLGELVAATRAISASLEPAAVMQGIVDAVAALTPGALSTLHVYDPDRSRLRSVAVSGDEARNFPAERRADLGLPGLVTKLRKPVVVRDPLNDPATAIPDWWRQHPGATYCGVPILVGETFLGVLDLIVRDRPPTREEQELIQLLAAHAAVAMQNAALYESERRQVERVRALAEVNRHISSALELDELLERIAQSAAHLTGVRYASFWIVDERRGQITFSRGSDTAISADLPRLALPIGEGGVGWVARHRQALVVDDLETDPRILHQSFWRRWDLRGWAAYPVITGDALLAVLLLSDVQPVRVAPDTQGMIELFTAQAAVAIRNARLYAESDRERREAAALATAARQLAASLDVDELAAQLVETLRDLFDAHASALYRVNERGEVMSVAFGGAAREHLRPGEVLQSGQGITGRVVTERSPTWSRDVLDDPNVQFSDELREAVKATGNRAVLGVPLMVKDEVIGVLAVAHDAPRDFDRREIALLQAFADQAALALENARLYATARESLMRLRDTQAQLVQAAKMSALGQLVSGVAHELNNPLAVVIGYGQLLLNRDLPPAAKRPVELMVSQGDRMAKIVRSLLFFARQRPPERSAVQLNDVVEDTLSLRLNQLTLSGISVERQLAVDLPGIPGDAQQLQQVFLNLVLNAEQAILDARRTGRIVVRTALTNDGGTVRADVIDDGPGISPDVLPHVFEPFYTTKEVGSGTGLGLSVSYGIVEEHGGRLTVETRPGETIFTVELPVAEAPPPVVPPVLRPTNGHGRAALIVEDEAPVRDLLVTLLTESGWRVDIATGGHIGLDRLRVGRYDLIVSDMRMPDGDGEEFYVRATALDATLSRRFIFLTGDTANPAAWRFLQQAQVPVLEKPFTPATFLDAVRRLIAPLTPSASSA